MNSAMRWGARGYRSGQTLRANPFPVWSRHAEDWQNGWVTQQSMDMAQARMGRAERTAMKIMALARLAAGRSQHE